MLKTPQQTGAKTKRTIKKEGTGWRRLLSRRGHERGQGPKKEKMVKCFIKKCFRNSELRKSCLGGIKWSWEKSNLGLKCNIASGTY